MTYYISNDYLAHHGVKGMHWGIRKARPIVGGKMVSDSSDSSVTKRVKNDYNTMSNKEFRKKYYTTRHAYARRVRKYGDPYMHRMKTANAVKEYDRLYDEASAMQDRSDAMFRKANAQRAALAKTKIGRFREVVKATKGKGSAAANEYIKTYDKASALGDKASDLWRKSDTAYHQTGKTYLSRVYNNMAFSKNSKINKKK